MSNTNTEATKTAILAAVKLIKSPQAIAELREAFRLVKVMEEWLATKTTKPAQPSVKTVPAKEAWVPSARLQAARTEAMHTGKMVATKRG